MAKLSAPNAGAKNAKKSVKIKKIQDQKVEAHLIDADARHDAADANANGASTPQLSMGASFSFAAAAQDAAAGASLSDGSGGGFPVLPVLGGLAVAGGVAAFALGGGGEKNVAPTLAAVPAVAGKEDTASTITLSGSDTNQGDTLTYTASTPANGTASVSGSTVTYTPKANFNGTDTFTVTVTDKAGLTASQTVTVNVAAVNDAPTFAAATQAIAATEDKSSDVTLAATDVDGDALTYTASTPSKGSVTVAGTKLTYTPNADYNGTDSVVVTASDGKGGTATQTITFTVAAVVPEAGSIDVGTANSAVTVDASKDNGGNSPADWALNDDSSKETNVIVNNFTKGDTINVTGKSTDYSFTTVGSDLVITYNNTTASVVNKIVLAGVAPTGFVSDEASAEAVLGYNFFNAATSTTGSGTKDAAGLAAGKLDSDDDGNVLTAAIVDASKAAIAFTENANVANTVRITGFTKDDTITLSNAQVSNYSFQGIGTDVVMTYNNSGVVNSITLAGINANGGVISSYNDVKTLVGADFFKVASTPAPTNSQSIDNGTANSPVSYNASASGINFTDNAASETNVKITGFGADDRITVTGATSSQYSFTTINTDGNGTADLVITFNNTAASVVNSITLLEAVSANAFVSNFATAQAAMNNSNFMVFG